MTNTEMWGAWKQLDKSRSFGITMDMLGSIPYIVMVHDPRPIKEQIADRYAHGGGYSPMSSAQWRFFPTSKDIKYPGDPLLHPIAELQVRDELFIMYQHAICLIVQKDGTFDVLRMD